MNCQAFAHGCKVQTLMNATVKPELCINHTIGLWELDSSSIRKSVNYAITPNFWLNRPCSAAHFLAFEVKLQPGQASDPGWICKQSCTHVC